MRLLTLSLAFAAVVIGTSAHAQQLYKYTGPDGRVQYSDQPPAVGQKAKKVTESRVSTVSSGTPAEGDGAQGSAPKSPAEKEQEFRQRRIAEEEKARKDEKLAQESRAKADACERMRSQLAGMQGGGRFSRYNAKGEREFLDDGQVQQEIVRLQREIAGNCK
jgi:Domain of unknown function (DUF4124)